MDLIVQAPFGASSARETAAPSGASASTMQIFGEGHDESRSCPFSP